MQRSGAHGGSAAWRPRCARRCGPRPRAAGAAAGCRPAVDAGDGRSAAVRARATRAHRVRRPHAHPRVALARRRPLPLGQRPEGDAARRLPAPVRGAGARHRAIRAPAALADDPSLGQSGREQVRQDRRRRGAAATCAASRDAALRGAVPRLGRKPDQRARPSALHAAHRWSRSHAATGASRWSCWRRSCHRSAGGSPRSRRRGWRLYFKGGWGTGTGLVDHQVALLTFGRQRVSIAILTQDNGSHDYGKQTLRGIAELLLGGLGPGVAAP